MPQHVHRQVILEGGIVGWKNTLRRRMNVPIDHVLVMVWNSGTRKSGELGDDQSLSVSDVTLTPLSTSKRSFRT
jgi:hypothetical protein